MCPFSAIGKSAHIVRFVSYGGFLGGGMRKAELGREIQKKRERTKLNREGEILYQLVDCPNYCNNPGWASLKPGA